SSSRRPCRSAAPPARRSRSAPARTAPACTTPSLGCSAHRPSVLPRRCGSRPRIPAGAAAGVATRAGAWRLCLVLLENRAQLVDEELHVVEHRVFGGGEIRHPFHDGLVVGLHLRQRLVQRVHAGAEPVALGLQRRPVLLQRFELVAHLAGLLNQLAILGDRVDDSFDAGRHGSTSAMPSRSPRLFTHSVGGGGDVTHSTSMANVALSWPMTAAMTNAHVLRRPCFARAPQTSRLPRIRRDSARFVAIRRASENLARPLPAVHAMRFQRRSTQTVSEASTAFISEGSEVVGTCNFNGSVVVSG